MTLRYACRPSHRFSLRGDNVRGAGNKAGIHPRPVRRTLARYAREILSSVYRVPQTGGGTGVGGAKREKGNLTLNREYCLQVFRRGTKQSLQSLTFAVPVFTSYAQPLSLVVRSRLSREPTHTREGASLHTGIHGSPLFASRPTVPLPRSVHRLPQYEPVPSPILEMRRRCALPPFWQKYGVPCLTTTACTLYERPLGTGGRQVRTTRVLGVAVLIDHVTRENSFETALRPPHHLHSVVTSPPRVGKRRTKCV